MTAPRERARLEYLNSQEPGDASQASAFDIVDRLLVEDDMEASQTITVEQISATKSPPTLGSKVAQFLAKRVDHSYPLEKAAVFDWLDTPNLDDCISGNISRENPRVHVKNRLDSQGCGGYGSGTRAGAMLECIDEDLGMNYLKKPEPVGATEDSYAAYDIGPNTQMAAEAMEALFNGPTVSSDVREHEHLENTLGKENKVDTICSVNLLVQEQKLACLPQSSGGMTSQLKQLKVDHMGRPRGESSIPLTNCPSKSKTRRNAKQMTGKAKRSTESRVSRGAINDEVSDVIMGSGAEGPNSPCLLGKNAVIHPKRKRTYTFTSGSSKVGFKKATRSSADRAETTEVTELPRAKPASVFDPDTIKGMKLTHKSSSGNLKASATTTRSKVKGVQKEASDTSQLERTLSAELKKQSTSEQKVSDSCLANRVPLRELRSTEPQSKAHTSKKPLKRGLLKSPASRELASLFRSEASPVLQSSRRRRRNMSTVCVLFSQSMDSETIKDQTKILMHFGLPVATTISEATHFVAEKFARTRNMLEAMAMGIPVVTPSWLECCGEARCFIDEKKYIMRDTKKEKELRFSMPVSLSQACKKPLLEGRRVLITRNAKPSKELLKCLVVAAGGKLLERITVSMMKNKNLEGAFVISCEQDGNICLPFIKNGLGVFDSELLLNGIVVQKLEFERYRLSHDKM
ncbi:mediator of DNA damage checkpoint protein 1-like [Triticum urartu]|uniref:mediator of DNA damage checkpoint protein 1-like n=1 Tax=Triticum urartu TaxID=4572 RepID=UPI0020443723|nr:mediator of DNA damage checkpoint protein 1-like [Triticum urartu]